MRRSISISATLIIFFSYSGLMAAAQERVLKEMPGTYRNATITAALKTASGLNKLRGTDRSAVVHNLTAQHQALMQTAALKSVTGMEARLYAYVQPASAFQKMTTSEMRVMFYPFTKSIKKGLILPVDEAPATLSVYTNNLDKILFNTDGWWDVTKRAGYPQFFDKFPLIDSTTDYITINAKKQTFRILQLNHKPVFVPLTRKEFLQFLVADATQQLQQAQKIVQDNQANAKRSKTNNDSYLKIYKDNITVWQKNAAEADRKIQQYKAVISGMTPQEAGSGAYINHNKTGGYYNQLASAGRKDGQALYKVNPDYFDKNKSPSTAQLIIVTYWCHKQFCPEWLQSCLNKIFEAIDYNMLNNEMN